MATDDAEIIGREAWKLLQGFNFDPKELRGIGIQIQKLDDDQASRVGADLSPGQRKLDFTRPRIGQDQADSNVAGSSALGDFDGTMPTMSQVDPSVLECLPEEIRSEVLRALKAGNASGAAADVPVAVAAPPSRAPSTSDDAKDDVVLIRSQSMPAEDTNILPPNLPDGSKARSISPNKIASWRQREVVRPADVRHITKQLAPKRKTTFISSSSSSLFQSKAVPRPNIIDAELISMGVDPVFFQELPLDVQLEQLEILKQQSALKPTFKDVIAKDQESRSRSASVVPVALKNLPIPIAAYSSLPSIKKLTKVEDVQDMITQWVKYREEQGPIPAEVQRIAGYLLKCCATDIGLQQVTSILRWWRRLLRERWRSDERQNDVIDVDAPGPVWWAAFAGVKRQVDKAIRPRFGTGLALGK